MIADLLWKKKADRLKQTILSAAHQVARELPTGLSKLIDLFRVAAQTGDVQELQAAFDQLPAPEARPLWEPAEIYGWKINATLYLLNGQLWWLLHAMRSDEGVASDKHVAVLDKVLDYLGADPKRDLVIGPRTTGFFGWWTWFNRSPLCEIHVHRGRRGKSAIRVVPQGTRPTDGFERFDPLREGSRE